MPRPTPVLLTVMLLGMSLAPSVVAQRVGVTVSTGHHWPGAGTRYKATQSSWWHMEGLLHFTITPDVALAAGVNWSVFEGDVTEFAVFEPLDHAPWLSQTHLFLEGRYFLPPHAARLKPYLAGRLGWALDYAEFAGAEVRRSGPMVGGQPGLTLRVLGPVHLDLSAFLALARLGEAQVLGERRADSSSGSSLVAVRLGVGVRF